MGKRLKITAILPAYNAAKTLRKFLKSFPFKFFDEVILVDDASEDATFEIADRSGRMKVFKNDFNLGYGGNLKVCLGRALEAGADIVVEIHPDGEYGFDGVPEALKQIENGANLVLGNRFEAGPKGMAGWKLPFARLLSKFGNLVLGTNVPDLHQGFRVYTRELLEKILYRSASNNYIFSFEIIAQAVFKGLKISSVPVSAYYKGKKRGASFKASVIYSLGVLGILGLFILAKVGLKSEIFGDSGEAENCTVCKKSFLVKKLHEKDGFKVFWCEVCSIGFTFPVPKDIQRYYPESYWGVGFLGNARRYFFKMFQKRRADWIKENLSLGGRLLDVGSGEGGFAEAVRNEFEVLSLESPGSKVKNQRVLKRDFLKFNPREKFDGILFWESFEHVDSPQDYLIKAGKLLKPGGRIFIEYPKFNCLENRIFGENWFHLDMPRHLSHFSSQGISLMAKRNGFEVLRQADVLAWEYSGFGVFSSFMSTAGLPVDRFKPNLVLYILFSPVIFVSFIFAWVFYTINQSPIGLLILKKENELHKKS